MRSCRPWAWWTIMCATAGGLPDRRRATPLPRLRAGGRCSYTSGSPIQHASTTDIMPLPRVFRALQRSLVTFVVLLSLTALAAPSNNSNNPNSNFWLRVEGMAHYVPSAACRMLGMVEEDVVF